MEIGAAAAGASTGAYALWGYNRKNFFFDRDMRMKNEYTMLDWRCKQSELWRDDVRDIIGLTEKKMDIYTIVSALQLGMCVVLFTEGRLEPGTPPWLLHFYMLTLAGAFMYLIMSVWLALHASIVAQCSSVRLLTQFVRLPVPTWQELEDIRTYAQSFEQTRGKHMLRVPFFGHGHSPDAASSSCNPRLQEHTDEKPPDTADPWGHEKHGHYRNIYELQKVPAALRRHVDLAKRAAEQYKCFDAFARVSMTFGTNQLLQAVAYYCLGYVSIQDGTPWAAWSIAAIMAIISATMINLDVSLQRNEQIVAQVLMTTGLVFTSCTTWLWVRYGKLASGTIIFQLPLVYLAHALWLLWALQVCGVKHLPCGSVLPTRFRAVLYLDVFGWIDAGADAEEKADCRKPGQSGTGYSPVPQRDMVLSEGESPPGNCYASDNAAGAAKKGQPSGHVGNTTPVAWGCNHENESSSPAQHGSSSVAESSQPRTAEEEPEGLAACNFMCSSPLAAERHEFLAPDSDSLATIHEDQECNYQAPGDAIPKVDTEGPSGAIRTAPPHAFAPTNFLPDPCADSWRGEKGKIVTGHDRIGPGELPWRLFRSSTWLLAALWGMGLALPFGSFREIMITPLIEEPRVEAINPESGSGFEHFAVGTDPSGLPEYIPEATSVFPELSGGELIRATWPSHYGFKPRALSSAPFGRQLAVADDFGVYTGQLTTGPGGGPAVHFEHAPPCSALDGQELKDISVVCSAEASPVCHVLVLQAHGRRLVQCPLRGATVATAVLAPQGGACPAWEISSGWLHRWEAVESVAVDTGCLGEAFHPGGLGCVVVGTTSGRIVQLRGHLTNETRLVPERAVRQWPQGVKQGSLHVLPNGYVVALREHTGSIEAFDARRGTSVGEWHLSSGIKWMMLSGRSDDLYVLGQDHSMEMRLYRFPVPPELRSLT